MNRWYQRRRQLTLALLAMLAVDAGVYFGWVRRPTPLPEADPAQLEWLSRDVSARAAEVARLERVRERAPQFRPQLDQFARERFLAARTGFSGVAADLEEAARQAGVFLGRVSYQTAEEKGQPDVLRVEIGTSVEGNYADLLNYLEVLERSPRLYLIDELNLVGAQSGQVRLEMRLATYLRRRAT